MSNQPGQSCKRVLRERPPYAEIADGYATGSSARRGIVVGDLPAFPVFAVKYKEAVYDEFLYTPSILTSGAGRASRHHAWPRPYARRDRPAGGARAPQQSRRRLRT